MTAQVLNNTSWRVRKANIAVLYNKNKLYNVILLKIWNIWCLEQYTSCLIFQINWAFNPEKEEYFQMFKENIQENIYMNFYHKLLPNKHIL